MMAPVLSDVDAATPPAGLPNVPTVTWSAAAHAATATELLGVWAIDIEPTLAYMKADSGGDLGPMAAELAKQMGALRIGFHADGRLLIVDPSGLAQGGTYAVARAGALALQVAGSQQTLESVRDGRRLVLCMKTGQQETVMILTLTDETFASLPAACVSCTDGGCGVPEEVAEPAAPATP
jgi:hypothetical protein